jgi:hypothetical protein
MSFVLSNKTGSQDAEKERRIRAIEERIALIPSRWARPRASAYTTIVVGGGNAALIGNSLDGIQYASGPLTPTSAYDPDVDTVYQTGIGWGYLTVNGVLQPAKVLVRHKYAGYPAPLLAGNLLRPCATETLSYDPGGGGALVPLTVYLWDWI